MGSRSAITSWGPATWTLYHAVSFKYPTDPSDDDRHKAFEFLYGVARMLPCVHCRTHWTEYLEAHVASAYSIHLASRDAFSRFLVDGHNEVNRRLNRPTVPYEVVRAWYIHDVPGAFVAKPTGDATLVLLALLLALLASWRAIGRCAARRHQPLRS